MKDKNKKTTRIDMQELFAYLDKNGINYTVDNNPSPEKIAQIKEQIKRSEDRARLIANLTLGKNL